MATKATAVPPVSRRNPPKLPSSTTIIKQELTNTTATGDGTPPQTLSETPDFTNSLSEIRKLSTALSTALSAFNRRYGKLQNHLKTAIDSKLPDQLNQLALIPLPQTSPKPSLPQPVNNTTTFESKPDSQKPNLKSKPDSKKPILKPKPESNLKSKPESKVSNLKPKPESKESNLKSKPETQELNLKSKPESISTTDSVIEAKCQKPVRFELENLCESMSGRSLRKYIGAHLSDSVKLREEVPKALKLARNPPRLVLESVGRFYLQGSKAYTKDKYMAELRRASVLTLECFLLMGCEGLEIENDVEREAAEAAVAWRKRIVSEGGFDKAAEIDARGLLMLISGFGMPKVFTNEDIREVMMATKVKTISSALRRSSNLVTRIPSIIELMVKKNLEVKAADIAYSLGLEDKCSPKKILTTFLHHTTKIKMQGSSEEVRTAKKKQLADLKSIIRCLEDHKIDPSDLLPESKIDEKIKSLEEEITELDKKSKNKEEKVAVKRKADESDTLKYWKSEDAKRTRFAGSNINGYSASPSIIPHGFKRPEDITDGSIAAGVLNTSPYGRVYGQPPAGQMMSQAYGSLSQSYAAAPLQGDAALSERLLSQAYAGRSYAAPSHGDAALSEKLLSQAYAGQSYAAPSQGDSAPSERLLSQAYAGQSYAAPSQGDAAPSERLLSQAYAGQSYAAPSHGDAALPSERLLSQGYAASTTLSERLVSQRYGGQTYGSQASSSGLTSLYRPSHLQSSLEGFAGLPSHSSTSTGVWNRGTGSDLYQFADSVRGSGGSGGSSDLYQFADSVVENETYNTSSSYRAGGGNLPAAHRSSYLY